MYSDSKQPIQIKTRHPQIPIRIVVTNITKFYLSERLWILFLIEFSPHDVGTDQCIHGYIHGPYIPNKLLDVLTVKQKKGGFISCRIRWARRSSRTSAKLVNRVHVHKEGVSFVLGYIFNRKKTDEFVYHRLYIRVLK